MTMQIQKAGAQASPKQQISPGKSQDYLPLA